MASTILQIIGNFQDNISGSLNNLQNNTQNLQRSFAGLGAKIAAAFGGASLLRGIVETNAEFDKLEAQVSTFSGSAEEAAASMTLIQDITSKTPFQLNEVTTAFTRMKALGLEPTREALMAFGDVAAGSGKSILQFTEAVADAAVGEFERLKEFGIKASKQGDQVSLTFKGVTTTVKNSSADIQKYLTELGQNQFGGAMEKQMDTMAGAWSNAKDQFALLARAIGEAGLNDILQGIAQAMGKMARTILENVDVIKGTWAGFVGNIIKGMEHVRYAFVQGWNYVKFAFVETINFIADKWTGFVNYFIDKWNTVAAIVPGMDQITRSTNEWAAASEDLTAQINQERQEHERLLQIIDDDVAAKQDSIIATKQQTQTVEEAEAILAKATATTQANTTATETNTKAKKKQLTVYESIVKSIEREREVTEQSWEAQEKLDIALQEGKITTEEYSKAIKQLNKNLGIQEEVAEKTTKAVEKQETVYSRLLDRIKNQRKTLKETKEAQIQLKEAYERGEITLREFQYAMDDLNRTLDQTHSSTESLSSAFGDFFGSIISGSGDAKDSLKALLKQLVSTTFEHPGGLSGAVGEIFGGSSKKTPDYTGMLSSVGDFFGGFFADGGFTPGFKPIVVGERGPELFLPKGPGNVISNENLSAALTPAVNINIAAMDGTDVMRVLSRNRREISEMVIGTQRAYGI